MNRRDFLKVSASAGLALCTSGYGAESVGEKKRVGLIGCGWYGKSDLFRLIQVAPVEVVSLCDVDRNMLEEAAEMVRKGIERNDEPAAAFRVPSEHQP